MKRILISYLKQFLFWLLVFAFYRLVFLLYNFKLVKIEGGSIVEAAFSFVYSIKLDIATSCYLLFIPLFLHFFQSLINLKWLNKINFYYTSLLVVLITLLTTVEAGIYSEWKTKLPAKAIMYLKNPSEIYSTASILQFFGLIMLWLLQSSLLIYVYYKFFHSKILTRCKSFIFSLLFLLVGIVLLAVGARGGLQPIPINQSESYYSKHQILNVAAVNSLFNLYINIFENYKNLNKNPFEQMSNAEANKIVNNIYGIKNDTTINILTVEKPNIVFIILESWSADLIESCGGEPGITPKFKELEKDGILMTNFYPTGPRSEQAMACIFSGFPAHPYSSITVQPDKFTKLPTITKSLIEDGYSTSFYFGGQLIYGNIKGFAYYNGFKKIIEQNDFDNNVIKGRLGVHDEFVLRRQLNDLNSEKQPFFSVVYTLSTHAPFDQPMKDVLNWGGNENKYINSAYYTDRCLGEYFKNVKKQNWYNNTLFVIVADHSHNSYKNWAFTTPAYHKIPLLFYGDVIKKEFKGMKISKLFNQTDIAKTLLAQLKLDYSKFKWSRNIFNPYSPEFAYYSFEIGYGWIKNNGYCVYDKNINNFSEINFYNNSPDSTIFNEGKAFMQKLFKEYIEY